MAGKGDPGRRQPTASPEDQDLAGIVGVSPQCETLPEPGAAVLTEKLWKRLRHNGRLVRDEVTGHLPPMVRPLAWQQFQQMPLARFACSLIQLLEPQRADAGLYDRHPRRPAGTGLFDDIPSLGQRAKAERSYAQLCQRHSDRLPSCPWLLPILAGRARDLALRPNVHGSEQGRRMRRIKGGIHVQRRYREQGWHPLQSVRKAWGLTANRPQA